MSSPTQPTNTKQRRTRKVVPAMARRVLALAFLLSATFGLVGAPGAAAQTDTYACNNLFRSGHGYYGCGGIDHAWEHGTYGWILYYW